MSIKERIQRDREIALEIDAQNKAKEVRLALWFERTGKARTVYYARVRESGIHQTDKEEVQRIAREIRVIRHAWNERPSNVFDRWKERERQTGRRRGAYYYAIRCPRCRSAAFRCPRPEE
jgi:hypothetical protein